jgi:hypothetical protein
MPDTPQCDAPQAWRLQPVGRRLRGGSPAHLLFPAVLGLALVLAACSGSRTEGPSFETEQAQVQSAMPREAQFVSSVGPRREGLRTEASWEYELGATVDAAKKVFLRGVPPGYGLVRESEGEAAYAKYDGHDSYCLTFIFVSSGPHSTRVTVLLKSIPD